MDRRSDSKSEEDVLRAFADLFDETLEEDPDDIDNALRQFGYDPAAIGKAMKAAAEQALQKSPLDWRNRAREDIERERAQIDSFTAPLAAGREKLLTWISDLLEQVKQQHGQQAVAHFRNLEEVTDEDLADLAAELQYLLSRKD